jgi:hypothetical protein
MDNQINQENQSNSEHSSFYDQADGKFNKAIQNQDKLAKGVSEDEDVISDTETSTMAESEFSNMAPEEQVRATEDASLQDESYSFDEANTDNEEFHDVDDYEDFDMDNDDDYVQ